QQRDLQQHAHPAGALPAHDRTPRQRRASSTKNVHARNVAVKRTRKLTSFVSIPPWANVWNRSNSENGFTNASVPPPIAASFHVSIQQKNSTPYVDAAATSWLSVSAERKSPHAMNAAARSQSPK